MKKIFLLRNKPEDLSEQAKISDEEYEKLMQQFEEDSKTHDFSDPFMDRVFLATLNQVREEQRRRKICRASSLVAGIMIISCLLLNCFTRVAYGETLLEIVKNSIRNGRFTITSISLGNQSQEFEEYDDFVVWYEAETVEGIFEQIIEDEENGIEEFFYVTGLPEQYEKWEAKYNKELKKLMIQSKSKDNYLYIFEGLNYDSIVNCAILESDIVSTVFNKNLQMNLHIIKQMDDIRCEGYCIELFYEEK